MTQSLDLSASGLALKDTFDLTLKHPLTGDDLTVKNKAGEQEPVSITLYGTASKQYRNALQAMQQRALRRNARKEKPSVEVMTEESITLLTACSAGAKNLSVDGADVGVGEPEDIAASFKKLYADPRFSWVKDQVDEALGDRGNFLSA